MGALLTVVFSASGPIVVLCIIALWIARRPASTPLRYFAVIAASCYLLASIPIVPYSVGWLLTTGYGELHAEDVPAGRTAVVLLGGGDRFVEGWTEQLTVTTATEGERVLEAARVFRLIGPAWIISSGGKQSPEDPGEPSAITMRDELMRLGVPADRIVLEPTSRDTHEEAVLIAPMLKSLRAERLVIVTSATHMRRSIGAFKAMGMTAIPAIAPGDGLPMRWFESVLPSTDGLAGTATVVHELFGIPYYWLRGWWRS
ncbi:MAG: hypothetical protein JWL71_4706 [Acidobacteria bacterium]|nr:hypothetical protein [Acidobacteriota bacterium]